MESGMGWVGMGWDGRDGGWVGCVLLPIREKMQHLE